MHLQAAAGELHVFFWHTVCARELRLRLRGQQPMRKNHHGKGLRLQLQVSCSLAAVGLKSSACLRLMSIAGA